MLTRWLSFVWRRLPKQVRRAGVLLTQTRFTVAAGAIIFDTENRVLLLHHRFRGGSGWGMPGGFINAQENPEAALRRELLEEIGLEIENLEIAFSRTLQKYRQVEIYFRGTATKIITKQNIEIIRAEWFAIDNLPPELSADQHDIILRAFSKI